MRLRIDPRFPWPKLLLLILLVVTVLFLYGTLSGCNKDGLPADQPEQTAVGSYVRHICDGYGRAVYTYTGHAIAVVDKADECPQVKQVRP